MMESDYDYNYNTSDDECHLWEEEEQQNEEKKEITYQSLPAGQIAELMWKEVVEVAGITGISQTASRILLSHHKWDREQLLEKIYSADDQDLEELVPSVSEGQFWTPSLHRPGLGPWSSSECEICYEEERGEMLGLSCGHQFCTQCWVEHITTRISHHHTTTMIECPASCKVILDDETVLKVLPEGAAREKYQQLLSASYVQSNPRLRWCSGPDCSLALSVSALVVEGRELTVTCSAGHSACFSCGLESHQPVSCRLLRLWTGKCQDDSETDNWVLANTKQCPKCQANIEKNGGCNHMICGTCKASFCWACLNLTGNHSHCNVWKEVKNQQRDRVKAQLERYLFYRDRFMNNLQSLKLEEQLAPKLEKRLTDYVSSWVDTRHFDQSLAILASCRRTLMNTYAFAYFLKKNNQKDIFEENQRDLSEATEELSRFLERDITTKTNIEEILPKVLDKYRYCEKRRQVLIDHVREGYENNLWEFYEENPSNDLEPLESQPGPSSSSSLAEVGDEDQQELLRQRGLLGNLNHLSEAELRWYMRVLAARGTNMRLREAIIANHQLNRNNGAPGQPPNLPLEAEAPGSPGEPTAGGSAAPESSVKKLEQKDGGAGAGPSHDLPESPESANMEIDQSDQSDQSAQSDQPVQSDQSDQPGSHQMSSPTPANHPAPPSELEK